MAIRFGGLLDRISVAFLDCVCVCVCTCPHAERVEDAGLVALRFIPMLYVESNIESSENIREI